MDSTSRPPLHLARFRTVWRHPAGRRLFAETGWVELDPDHIGLPKRGNTALLRFLLLELLPPDQGGAPSSAAPFKSPSPAGTPPAALVAALVRRLARHEIGLADRVREIAFATSTAFVLEMLRSRVGLARAQAGSLIMVRGANATVMIRRVAVVRCHDHPVASAGDRHNFPSMAGAVRMLEWCPSAATPKPSRLYAVFCIATRVLCMPKYPAIGQVVGAWRGLGVPPS